MATRKKYTREFKQDAVRLVTEQGYKQTEAARNLGVDRGMLGTARRPRRGLRAENGRGGDRCNTRGLAIGCGNGLERGFLAKDGT